LDVHTVRHREEVGQCIEPRALSVKVESCAFVRGQEFRKARAVFYRHDLFSIFIGAKRGLVQAPLQTEARTIDTVVYCPDKWS
jgi:hypothetical protein